jgi:hypothetical protein
MSKSINHDMQTWVLDDMQTQEELDDSISCVGTPTFPLQEEEQESEDGLPGVGFGK